MNDASYGALVGLGPKRSGRVFKTRYMPNYKGLHLHLRPRRATRRARNAHRFVDADPRNASPQKTCLRARCPAVAGAVALSAGIVGQPPSAR